MWPLNCLFFFLLAIPFLLDALHAQPFDYPAANLSTLWTNNLSLEHIVSYPDGSTVRAILLRGSFGPSFACGFFCNAACDAFLFAVFIVYTNSGSRITLPTLASPQVVWSANRDRPVKENATLQFSKDGDLILRDVDGTIVWSTNTSGRSVVGMNLTETGNLVLVDKSNASVWNSFDHPTDSWVLGQTLREGQRLTTNISTTNWTQGQLYLNIVSGGFEAYVDSNPPQLYYQTGIQGPKATNKSTYITFTNGSLAVFSLFTEPGLPDTTVSLPPATLVQYMRLESDGHLRLYEWADSTGWKVLDGVFNIYPDDCAYPTVCGQYGICSNKQCSCPTYFRQVDDRLANLGCSPITSLSCQSTENHQLLPLRNVSYFNFIDPSAVVIQHTNVESCKQACLKNCSCKAALFQYGSNASEGSCYLPSQLFSLMNNNPAVSHFNSSAHIKVQIPPNASPTNVPAKSSKKTISTGVIIGIILGSLFVASLIIVFVVMLMRRKLEAEEEDLFDMVPGIPMRFSFEELKVATENFCRKLGGGGFGSVFEGTLSDGVKVAVKRLEGIGQGKKEFLAEVETIGSIHHINLVRLIGFCAEKSDRLLVYEYMCNGSLDKWIYKNHDVVLDWKTRHKIITDIAKGLSYLHEECRQRIAHLDIKPQNILLDEDFNAKVSDFGLSKLIDRDQSHVMTRMRGTPGYLAPEWLTSIITEKADVFSFGVVVMEIVCGRKNLDFSRSEESAHLIGLLRDKVEANQLLEIADSRCSDMELYSNEVMDTMKLAMWCLQSESSRRPAMSLVVKVLEGSTNVDSDINYNFTALAPLVLHAANNFSASSLPLASVLSGPR